MKGFKGGYHADGRLGATIDEISMEAQAAAANPSAEARRRAFDEIARLALDARRLLGYLTDGAPPLALAHA